LKAVVLAGGLGTRLRRPSPGARLDPAQAEAADRGLKALVPVAGLPFLDYGLSRLADAGVEEVVLVIGPASEAVREHYRVAPPSRVRLAFAVQREPLGSADALLAAQPLAGAEEFLASNSDDLYPPSALRGLAAHGRPGRPLFSGAPHHAHSNFPRERLARFATLEIGADGELRRIVEKPGGDAPLAARADAWYSMNLWRFSPAIFEACRRVPLSSRGERELPQAVGFGIAELGISFRTFPCAEGVIDLSTRDDIGGLDARLADERPRP
jgi:glucose-1-phosphate thymidylyltransferase